jgi:hypothetical protein
MNRKMFQFCKSLIFIIPHLIFVKLILLFIYLFGSTGVWIQGLVLARQALYCWSNASSSFCFGYLGGSALPFARAGLNHYLPSLRFPPLLGWQLCSTMPQYVFHWDGVSWPSPFGLAGLELRSFQSYPPR